MGQALQVIKPIGGINTDIADKYLPGTQIRYGLNMERAVNNGNGQIGYNNAVSTPAAGNMLADYAQPAGDNFPIGRYYAKRTGEVYVFVHNDLGNHHIYRVNRNNTIDVILQDPELGFSRDPKYRIRHIHLFFNHNSFKEADNRLVRKYLTWTTGNAWQGFLEVETALATKGFHVPYFDCKDRTQLWQLATRPSLVCPEVEYDDDVDLQQANQITDRPWQFRTQGYYTDGRKTAWSPPSLMLVPDTGCQASAESQPQCINLRLDAYGPQVEKVRLAFSNCSGAVAADQSPEWFECELIEKYKPCLESNIPFWDRQIRDDIDYDPLTNTFLWQYCGEGTCIPIDRRETSRNFIPIPKYSFCLAPVENKLMLINNIEGDDPVDCAELAKITLSQTDREDRIACQPTMCSVKVAIVVHNFFNYLNQPVYLFDEISSVTELEGKTQCFGGLRRKTAWGTHKADPRAYLQCFGDTTAEAGFIVYVEGAEPIALTKQYRSRNGILEAVPYIDNWGHVADDISSDLTDGDYFFVQVAELKVVQGTKGFIRVAGHRALMGDRNVRETSTNVIGVMRPDHDYHATRKLTGEDCDWSQKELYFDTCGKTEVDLTARQFVICDLSRTDESGNLGYLVTIPFQPAGTFLMFEHGTSRAFTGYLRQVDPDDPSEKGRPVPGATMSPISVPVDYKSAVVTDHNGYYFLTFGFTKAFYLSHHTLGADFWVQGGDDCTLTVGGTVRGEAAVGTLERDVSVDMVPDYPNNFYQPVDVTLKTLDGQAIAGINVVIQGTKAEATGFDGIAHFALRHNLAAISNQGTTQGDLSRLVVLMQSGLCYLTRGDNCDGCMPEPEIIYLPECMDGPPDPLTVDFSYADLHAPQLDYGYHPGGIYPFSVKLMDAAGRETFAQKLTLPQQTITLDSIQKKQHFTFSDITFQLNGFTAPAEYVKMAILIGPNRAFDDFVSWVADKVEFTDSSGTQTASGAASKILLSIRSLYDASNIYAFGTNVSYQWQKGDRVEIIANADGQIFPIVKQFNIEASYNNMDVALQEGEQRYNKLVISYNRDLINLEEGCLLKIIRNNECLPVELYYECCQTIDLVAGVPQVTGGVVSGWDTYMVRRGIRWEGETHEFPFPFLHHSPSDYWGDHCICRGRKSIVNPYEKRLQYGRKMKLSMNFLENSNYNGLNDFDNTQDKTFSGEQRGDIVFVYSREQLFMLIFERDNGIINSANEFVRVNQSGQVIALPPDSIVSEVQSKIVGNYGCRYEDTGTVVAGDGWVFWVDGSNKIPVIHNWSEAADASIHPQDGPQVMSYWKTKLQRFREGFMTCGYDKVSGNVMVTFFKNAIYTHSRREYAYAEDETIAFNVADRRWPTTLGFCPEDHVCFPDNDEGDIFITFKGAKPYLHRVTSNILCNTFYGVPGDQVFEFIINEVPEKVKGFLTLQQQVTGGGWWADRIISSLGHTSKLPPVFVKKLTEGKYDCCFRGAENRKGGLHNGPQLRGNWLQVRVIRDNSVNNAWNSVDAAKQALYSELDRFIAKYEFSEQSAYNTNNQ